MYKVFKDKIEVYDKSQFCSKHIFECGQIFTYEKINQTDYVVFSKNKMAKVVEKQHCYEILTDDTNYFVDFFDLNTDYNLYKIKLCGEKTLDIAMEFGYGIRLLKQDVLEVIISFIFSQNNNIKRISNSMRALRMFGEDMGGFYSFPSIQKLATLTQQNFKDIGAGYRASYLVDSIKKIKDFGVDNLKSLNKDDLNKFLLSLKGVGEKVKDCIVLFAFNEFASFPVDTWVEKVYISLFNEKPSRSVMSKKLCDYYKNLSGIAQQYLFYYFRENM